MRSLMIKEKRDGFFLRFETFAQMGQELEKVFSPSASSVIKRVMGRPCGKRSCRRISEVVASKEKALNLLSKWKSKENWGELTFQDVNFENGTGIVIIRNSFEAKALAMPRDSPYCHFFGGFLEGFLSELFQRPITVVEEKCAAMGDEHCEFRFTSSTVLYVEEAIKMRDKIVRELASRHNHRNK